MSIFTVKRTCILSSLAAILIIAPLAYAIFTKLSTNLVAAVTIGGVKPSGNANIDQSKYPSSPRRTQHQGIKR